MCMCVEQPMAVQQLLDVFWRMAASWIGLVC
jgi:hypothetical protein